MSQLSPLVRRFFPWVAVDLPLVWSCYALALLVRGVTADLEYWPALLFGLLASVVVLVCNEAFGIYRRWWRFATSQDLVPLSVSVGSATVVVVGLDLAWPGARPMPLSVVFLGSFFALCGMTAVRYRTKPWAAVKRTWRRLTDPPGGTTTRVLIVGAGEAGQHLGWQLRNGQPAERHEVVGFVDDDPRKHGMLIHGRKVLGGRERIPALVEQHDVDLIVVAIHTISGRDFRDIVGTCQETTAQIKVLPNLLGTIQGEQPRITPGQGSLFGDVTLEDLLGRRSVTIDREACRVLVRGKVVLVTGASGSIGAELCRQLADLRPARLLMLDANESGLHDLHVELQGYRSDDTQILPIVGDITHEARMRALFERERPELVFHAAAYKHVPLMEEYPEEAVRVNVGGTRLMMQLAAETGAERFVLVSSDKAVEPSSVMGATKRVCELLGASMPPGRTRFTAVRFGNVLASRGSVVPTFAKQIDLGGPVTITDPEMKRYFMSVAEASSLIIQAANFTRGGDVFLLDMGEEMNVAELARRMIRLRGLRPDIDIPIVVTGARPGEKLREVLTATEERTEPTPHAQVMRVLDLSVMAADELARAVGDLLEAAGECDRRAVRALLWSIARDGVAPVPLRAGSRSATAALAAPLVAPLPPIARPAAAAGLGYGGAPASDEGASPPVGRPAAEGSWPLSDGAPLAVAAERALALEPWYVLPAAAILLAYPNPLVGPAVGLLAVPWLVRLARTGRLSVSTPFDASLLLFLLGAVIGLLVTTNAVWGGIRMTGVLAGLALFGLIVNYATDIHRLKRALVATAVAAALGSVLLVVLTAPYLPMGAQPGPLDGLIAVTDPLRDLVLGSEEALERYRFRASGVGALATFGLALAVGPALAAAHRSMRVVGSVLAAFFLAIIVLSGNIGSLVSVVALGTFLLGLRNGWFMAAVPSVLIGLWAMLQRGLLGVSPPDALPLTVKIGFWQNAAAMLHDFAFTGAGLGLRGVRDLYESYFLAVGPSFSHAHNAYIQAYLEQGLLGCAGLVTLTITVFFYARRTVASARQPLTWGTALSAAGAAMVLLFEGLTEVVLLTSLGTVLLLVALGLLVAAGRLDARPRPAEGRVPGERPWLPRPSPRSALGGLAVLAVTFVLSPYASSVFLNLGAVERSRAFLEDGVSREERDRRLARAEASLRQGIAIDDRDPSLWRHLAEIAIARGEAGEARSALRQARERTPASDGMALFQLGRVARAGGFTQDAILAWQAAGRADALRAWAAELRGRGQWDRASAVLFALAELRPNDADVHAEFAQAARRTRLGVDGTILELERLAEA
ncbi:MAG: SDR family NAD(P)-dependent oxidoreductase, partial [Chloroflexota bacterium]|nr:SDR family NAD(P)-dependent oxidoreductase [Chloroflexota bacterium]